LRFHAIDTPESRGGIGSLPHTSAVVREKDSGQKWVIDVGPQQWRIPAS